jgi:hypothetical protein
MTRAMSNPTAVARAALGAIAVFPLIVFVLHIVQAGDYHPLSQAVSELALGRGGWLMAVAFCSLGTGTLLLALALRHLVPAARIAPWLIWPTFGARQPGRRPLLISRSEPQAESCAQTTPSLSLTILRKKKLMS